MELWWWVEPLGNTGCVVFILGLFISWIVSLFTSPFSNGNHILWIIFISIIPLFLAFLSTALWFICFIFYVIWTPYL